MIVRYAKQRAPDGIIVASASPFSQTQLVLQEDIFEFMSMSQLTKSGGAASVTEVDAYLRSKYVIRRCIRAYVRRAIPAFGEVVSTMHWHAVLPPVFEAGNSVRSI